MIKKILSAVVPLVALLVFASSAHALIRTGQFNVKCTPAGSPPEVHYLTDDPIVHPGQPGTSHEHVFAGNRTTNAFSTSATMLAGTSALTDTIDVAGYWTPTMFFNGVRQAPTACLIYYRAGRSLVQVTAQPNGLKMLAGFADATSTQPADVLTWTCVPAVPGQGGVTVPSNCNGGKMQADIKFPECWDGVNLDSFDHRSHLARSVGDATNGRTCPAGYPVMLGQLTQVWTYPDPAGRAVTLSSGSWMGFHGDAWEFFTSRPHIDGLFTNCINANVDCGTITA